MASRFAERDEILRPDRVERALDDVAERIVTIGGAAEGRAAAVARARPTQGVEDGLLKVRSVVEQICAQLERATRNGRAAKPTLSVGVCGEHGGDPKSIEFCHHVGLNYVSCSPFRVPVARLAAAQAAIANGL